MILSKINSFFYNIAILSRIWLEGYIFNFDKNNDISRITEHIYVGNLSTSTNKELLKINEIKNIICIMSQPAIYFNNEFNYLYIPAYNIPDFNLSFSFPISNTFINTAIQKNEKIFIHCIGGTSRSIALVLSYLMWKFPDNSLEEHLINIISKRESANPNIGFLEQLRNFNKTSRMIQ